MDHRQLGRSGFKVPALSLGAATFGGANGLSERWGSADVAEASRMVDRCLDHGVTLVDTVGIHSEGTSEEILGAALKGKRTPIYPYWLQRQLDERNPKPMRW